MLTPSTSILDLSNDAGWIDLQTTLDDSLQNKAIANILERLKAAGATSALVENDYLDRDYSEEFNGLYGRLFRRFRRHARRLHFFRSRLFDCADGPVSAVVAHMEEACKANDYLGFAVIRPVKDAPLGRAVLRLLTPIADVDVRIQVRAEYETHPLGAKLKIYGVPFTQQDARISACAQASIWVSGRHFHTRHRGPWFSTVAITEAASKPTDITLATALPAGSSGLNVNNMLRALRAMDRHPYAFSKVQQQGNTLVWPNALDPADILARYVGSGIPVILGLAPWAGQREWHAVVAVGDSFELQRPATLSKSHSSIGALSPYFVVHDDQLGPYLRMGVAPGLPSSETPYNVQDHVVFIIVPLPDKVFIPAETAERTAWDYLRFYCNDWPALKAQHGAVIGASATLGDEIVEAFRENKIVARTYLTFGWKYKHRFLTTSAAQEVKDWVAVHDLPRMIWVTELGRLNDLNDLDPAKRQIFGHCVIDATSTGPYQPPLTFHAPGFLTLFEQSNPTFFADAIQHVIPIPNDQLYRPRVRRTVA